MISLQSQYRRARRQILVGACIGFVSFAWMLFQAHRVLRRTPIAPAAAAPR